MSWPGMSACRDAQVFAAAAFAAVNHKFPAVHWSQLVVTAADREDRSRPSQAAKGDKRTMEVTTPTLMLAGAIVGGFLLSQSSFAQSAPTNDRIDGGQAIQIKPE